MFLPMFSCHFLHIVSMYMLLSWHECFCSTFPLFLSFLENCELEQIRVAKRLQILLLYFKYFLLSCKLYWLYIIYLSLSCMN